MGQTDGSKAVGVPVSRYVGLGKQLGNKGNEKKPETALRVMDYLCTPEGLRVIANTLLPLKNSAKDALDPLHQDVYEDVRHGYIATPMYVGYTDIIVESG